jgi:hypothetical protein
LNNLVEQYLVFAEGQAMRRVPMRMADWVRKLDGFLTLNDRDILDNAGKISHDVAKQHAESQYEQYHQHRQHADAISVEKSLDHLNQLAHQLSAKPSRND